MANFSLFLYKPVNLEKNIGFNLIRLHLKKLGEGAERTLI